LTFFLFSKPIEFDGIKTVSILRLEPPGDQGIFAGSLPEGMINRKDGEQFFRQPVLKILDFRKP